VRIVLKRTQGYLIASSTRQDVLRVWKIVSGIIGIVWLCIRRIIFLGGNAGLWVELLLLGCTSSIGYGAVALYHYMILVGSLLLLLLHDLFHL